MITVYTDHGIYDFDADTYRVDTEDRLVIKDVATFNRGEWEHVEIVKDSE